MRYKAAWIAALIVGTVLCVGVGSAAAEGAASIAAAPAVPYGQQQFGNLSNGLKTQNGCGDDQYDEFWLLNVIAGDKVTVDWEAQQIDLTGLRVYPVGTTDFTWQNASDVASSSLSSNGKAELTFQATQTGAMPADFASSTYNCLHGDPGPYDFTANVQHKAVLGLARFSKLRHNGLVRVSAHTPDGGAITSGLTVTLQAKLHGWKRIGSAPVANGVAAVPVRISSRYKGRKLTLRAIAAGSGYQPASSSSHKARIS